jgi:hypothetical protein
MINQQSAVNNQSTTDTNLKCKNCGGNIKVTDKFCGNCGQPCNPSKQNTEIVDPPIQKKIVTKANFDSMYNLTESQLLEEFINRQLSKLQIDKNSKVIPASLLKRKQILNILFVLLLFIYIILIFFHFPLLTYLIGLVLLIILFKYTRNYNMLKYLKKQIQERPSEKITNIIMNVQTTFVPNKTKPIFIVGIVAAIILPLIIFAKPITFYEKMDNGYGVRFYTFGLTNFKTVNIPETYKGEEIVSIRGNVFANMPFLEEVNLPNSITEIRGKAFKNDISLTKINIPDSLEYLGGSAFYNCSSLRSVKLPDTLTYMGGETFYNAYSLENIELSKNLQEIRGNTFEECSSLISIDIPDSVTRIGGHAFYGASRLSEVNITENSNLEEIGSSAFRECSSLLSIRVPKQTYINSRAFKNSPTSIYYYDEYSDTGNTWNNYY